MHRSRDEAPKQCAAREKDDRYGRHCKRSLKGLVSGVEKGNSNAEVRGRYQLALIVDEIAVLRESDVK